MALMGQHIRERSGNGPRNDARRLSAAPRPSPPSPPGPPSPLTNGMSVRIGAELVFATVGCALSIPLLLLFVRWVGRRLTRSQRRRDEEVRRTAELQMDEINGLALTARIKELPEVEYCAEVMQDHPDDAECTVCLEAYEPGEVIRTLPCGHRFHRECIDRWLLASAPAASRTLPVCPICKSVPLRDAAKDGSGGAGGGSGGGAGGSADASEPGEGPGRLEIGAAGLEAARAEAGWEVSAAGGEVASADEALRGSLQAAVEGLAEEAEVQGRIALGEAPAEARREARAWREQARALLSGSNSRVHPAAAEEGRARREEAEAADAPARASASPAAADVAVAQLQSGGSAYMGNAQGCTVS